MKKLIFTFLLSTHFIFGFSQTQLQLKDFLIDSTNAPQYKKAFLVTNGDTLITWEKESNTTVVTYLNTKITTTQWEDSVEVCTQEGFMVEDFEEWCVRYDDKDELIFESLKNVSEYYFARYSINQKYSLNKSFTNGSSKKRWQYKNGDYLSYTYLNDTIEEHQTKADTVIIFSYSLIDTFHYTFKVRDSIYTKNKVSESFTYPHLDGIVEVVVFENRTDSSFYTANKSSRKYYIKCKGEKKYGLTSGNIVLESGIHVWVKRLECGSIPYSHIYKFLKPREEQIEKDGFIYPVDSIQYLNSDSIVLKTIRYIFKKGIPVKKVVQENGITKKSKLSLEDLDDCRWKIAEQIENLPIRGPHFMDKKVKVRLNHDADIIIEDSLYSLKVGLENYPELFDYVGKEGEELIAYFVFAGKKLDTIFSNPLLRLHFHKWGKPILIQNENAESYIIFINLNGKLKMEKAKLVLPVWFTPYYESE